MNVNEKIFELFDYIDENSLEEGESLLKHLTYVNSEWDVLPEIKMEDVDRTLLAILMIDLFMKVKDFDNMKKWIEVYLYDEQYQEQISFYNGKLEFEMGNYDKAYALFDEAFKLTNGRMLEGKGVYLDFYKNPEKYIKK
ncbi:MAG: hypothetical protein L3J20_09095 [Flavobacteriaceae bacterium]|nr:hypothetical protein [Flavobacteriaceae bacterium]